MRLLALLLFSCGLWWAVPAAAQPVAAEALHARAFSAERLGLPLPPAGLVADFTQTYRGLMPPAAFAMARDAEGRSVWAWVSARPSAEAAAADALAACQRRIGALQAECRVLARDTAVEGAAPAPLAEGTLGPFRFAPMLVRRGPAAARGVLVWGHGYGGADRDNRNQPVPGLAVVLNQAGWDVLRFDRHPGDDVLTTALPRLMDGLPALREAGYRRIVLGGHSRGGWQAILAAGNRPDLVEAVIATAPAAHGTAERPNNNLGAALDDFRRLLAGIPAEGPRVAIALFDKDGFDPDPDQRAAMVEALAQQRKAPTLVLRPGDGIEGHGGASDWRFTRFYASCVLMLVQAPPAAAPTGLRRNSCGGG